MRGTLNQYAKYTIGSASAGATLTAAYSGNRSANNIGVGGIEQVVLIGIYTPKAGQSNRIMYLKPEFSFDGGTSWYPFSTGDDAAASSNIIVTTMYDNEFAMVGATGGTTYYQRVPIAINEYGVGESPLMRVSIKESGSDNFGTGAVIYSISGQ